MNKIRSLQSQFSGISAPEDQNIVFWTWKKVNYEVQTVIYYVCWHQSIRNWILHWTDGAAVLYRASKSSSIRIDVTTRSFADLRRCLGLGDLTFLAIGSMIGSGLYVLTGTIAHSVAGPSVIVSYIIAALASGLSAVCYAGAVLVTYMLLLLFWWITSFITNIFPIRRAIYFSSICGFVLHRAATLSYSKFGGE